MYTTPSLRNLHRYKLADDIDKIKRAFRFENVSGQRLTVENATEEVMKGNRELLIKMGVRVWYQDFKHKNKIVTNGIMKE